STCGASAKEKQGTIVIRADVTMIDGGLRARRWRQFVFLNLPPLLEAVFMWDSGEGPTGVIAQWRSEAAADGGFTGWYVVPYACAPRWMAANRAEGCWTTRPVAKGGGVPQRKPTTTFFGRGLVLPRVAARLWEWE
ncbi:hypothetical protein PIB30_069612, partial [Stylosanthes scabra]|nr:hypothetical protein [Stylosanthes scabra]